MNDLSVSKVIEMIDQGREFDLRYQDEVYTISNLGKTKGIAHDGQGKEYKSGKDIFDNYTIDGKSLNEVWDKIEVDYIF
ncbi:hypothetical protein M3N64_07640 [Sporolactobacillus sp. CPB3-1]|uniref:Uncharacterized protein n=1 Tax=Sporolactobacillus mangiferae TaxID=2940498 RepID=A0ABT0MAC1_9BACL|nr:hypothetical protein [Sporolactobacillus mangiferae]MCL1631821.1 hypothetical protein [Sporolactobacillus mangiferae]